MSDSQYPGTDKDQNIIEREPVRYTPGAGHFDAVFSMSATAMAVLSPGGAVLIANEAFHTGLGYPAAELYQMNYADLIHPDDRLLYTALVVNFSGGSPAAFETTHRLLHKDGRIIRAKASLTLVHGQNGDTILLMVEDVSARQALREEECRMRALADNSPDYISLSGPDGAIIYLNNAGRSILAIPPDANPGSCEQHIAPGERARMREEILPLLERHGHWEGQCLLYQAGTGQTIPVQMKLWQITDPLSGRPLGTASICHDMRAELAVLNSIAAREEHLQSAVELAKLGTWNIDLAAGIISYSARVRELYGLPEGPVALSELRGVHPGDAERVAADMERALQPGAGSLYDSEHRALNELTGEVRFLHSQGRVLFDAAGKPATIIGTVQDITEQRLARQALERQVAAHTEELYRANQQLQDLNSYLQQSNSELEQFAYVASHDLQEPLRKISVFAGMLAKMPGLPPDATSTAEKISIASVRMTQLIRDLLDFSHLLKGEHSKRPTDLNKIVAVVLNDFDLLIAERGAIIEVDELPTIEAVSLQMNQLFYNLISNALKFVREGVRPRIHIRCRKLDEGEHSVHGLHDSEIIYYFISVSDNGIGFSNRYSEQIFEVFKRLHTRQTYPGSGIGLALCRRILQNHGGIMTAQSEEGVGTTISMILPSRQLAEPWQAAR